jgi:hypothetical protein
LYSAIDEKAFPGITLSVTDQSGSEGVTFEDMLAKYAKGVSPDDR